MATQMLQQSELIFNAIHSNLSENLDKKSQIVWSFSFFSSHSDQQQKMAVSITITIRTAKTKI